MSPFIHQTPINSCMNYKRAALNYRLTFVAVVALITWESRTTILVACARLSRFSGATRRRKFRWRTSSRCRWLPGTFASTLSLGLPAAASVWGWRFWVVLYQVANLLGHFLFRLWIVFFFPSSHFFIPTIFFWKERLLCIFNVILQYWGYTLVLGSKADLACKSCM